MKILYVTSDANWGGSSVALYNLISGITDKNDIYVLMPHDRGELSFKLKKIGVKCFYTKFYNSTYPSYNTVNDICKFLYTSNPQPIGFSGILLAKRQNSFYCTYFLHNRNVTDTKSPYPIKRLEVIRRFNQKSMVFNQSLS